MTLMEHIGLFQFLVRRCLIPLHTHKTREQEGGGEEEGSWTTLYVLSPFVDSL